MTIEMRWLISNTPSRPLADRTTDVCAVRICGPLEPLVALQGPFTQLPGRFSLLIEQHLGEG